MFVYLFVVLMLDAVFYSWQFRSLSLFFFFFAGGGGGGIVLLLLLVLMFVCLFVCFLVGRFLRAGMHVVQN